MSLLTTNESMKKNHVRTREKVAKATYFASLKFVAGWPYLLLEYNVDKVKYDGKGNVERFKGRLVAQGYSQKYGIDYEETFSPVAHFSFICSIIAYAVEQKMLIHQMDVVTAFLNGDLKEDIYMRQPPGYAQAGRK